MSAIRVLVVEDSLTVRKRILEVIQSCPDFEVVGEAENGKQGIELCQALRPDVVSLDMMMPVMNGLAATEYIMAYCPTPILIVSSSTNRGELFRTYEALAAGALEVLDKPEGIEPNEDWEERLLSNLRIMAHVRVITHPRGRLGQFGVSRPAPASAKKTAGRIRAIAIGASTGGPAAVLEILKNLPPDFPLPILLVIHISLTFGDAFADWLDGESPLRVAYARNGDALPPFGEGRVIMAPPDFHLRLRDNRLWLTQEPDRHSCRPSVDILFESVGAELKERAAACLLTGMGRDGAEGLLTICQAGGVTIAQDEATSAVFGMPREAIHLGAAKRVLRLDQMAPALMALTNDR